MAKDKIIHDCITKIDGNGIYEVKVERYEEHHKKAKIYKSILEDMLDRKAED